MNRQEAWSKFRKAGLLLFINQFLHIFGWAIKVEIENGVVINAYPDRVKFRGFDEKSVSEAYIGISEYMKENSENLLDEASE